MADVTLSDGQLEQLAENVFQRMFKQQEDDGIYIDGKGPWSLDDLSFAERDEVCEIIRKRIGDDKASISDVRDDGDVVPAIVYLIKRRTVPDYTLDDARKLAPKDLAKPEPKPDPQGAGAAAGEPNKNANGDRSATSGTPTGRPRTTSTPGSSTT